MMGVEVIDFVRFFMQISAGVMGAASLWGFVFWIKGRRNNNDNREAFITLSRFLFIVFLAAINIFLFAWLFVFSTIIPDVQAHEGIVLRPLKEDIIRGFQFNLPVVFALTLVAISGIFIWRRKDYFRRYGGVVLLLQFLLISLILLFGVNVGEFSRDQIFFWLHNWHSIITVGTVAIVDILYIRTLHDIELKRVLYPFFPAMSAAIWIGLGIDFASVFLIVKEALHVTQQFLFNQTVIAILIINGAFLSGKMNDLLINLVHSNKTENYFPPKTNLIFGLSGSLSIVSWTTITFLDFVKLPFPYVQFLIIYLSSVAVAFFSRLVIEKVISTRKIQPPAV